MENVIHALIWAFAILVTSFVMAQNGFEKSTTSTLTLIMVMAATATLTIGKRSCAVCR